MKITPFNVVAKLPPELEPLREIAYNVWFSWNWEAVHLFIRLDPKYWESTYQNPALMLGAIPQERLEEVAQDDSFIANMKRVHERFKAYMSAPTWFDKNYPDAKDKKLAYFSLEYGIDVGLPIYSGGLGVLAGDHLKSASDLGLPLAAVGLLYRQGFMKQYLTADGWQREEYPVNDWYNMPVTRAHDAEGKPISAQVELAGEPCTFHIWTVQVGRIPLYLLDTDLPENKPEHRAITMRLYDGDRGVRLQQELVLGIGGLRALEALGIEPTVCHMNEGHSAFLTLERIRQIMHRYNLPRNEAWEIAWASQVFTTHTPVPAGNERFDPSLVQHYVGPGLKEIGMPWEELLALGRENPADTTEEFCLTVLALHHAAYCNGVSELHGHTSRALWRNLWPGQPVEEVPIGSVTNGIHARSFLSHDMVELLERYIGPKFEEEPMDFDVLDRVAEIPDVEIWRTHDRRRERLVWFARKRLRQQLLRRGASPHVLEEADQTLDPEALTIGFARRFAAYKRGTLLLNDPKRLHALLNNPQRPVQIIFAGKAHPSDTQGKELIKQLYHFIRREGFRNRIVFIEDYDINVARYLVQGCDVWLNTPRRPHEASGTSGMKAAVNGALNVSTLDGWWCEGYSPDVGWVIGSGETYDDHEEQDRLESGALYEILEQEVVPLFYDRGRDLLPRKWIARMKTAMRKVGAYFNSNRMVADYMNFAYRDAAANYVDMTSDGQAEAKGLAAWRARIRRYWSDVRIESVESNAQETLSVGDKLNVSARVRLGNLRPEEVSVHLYHGAIASPGEVTAGACARMQPDGDAHDGAYTYRCAVACLQSGRRGFALRVLPGHPDAVHPFEPGKVVWA